jgi:ElaB/YqjD/DUF883 family membrane-anchored ribosome-binding protein
MNPQTSVKNITDIKDDTMKKAGGIRKSIEHDVNQGMKRYNKKVQDLADQVPGSFSKKAARYPWVTISIAVAVGLLLGISLTPSRRSS